MGARRPFAVSNAESNAMRCMQSPCQSARPTLARVLHVEAALRSPHSVCEVFYSVERASYVK